MCRYQCAEESELIVPLGHWVLRSSCLEAGRWSDDIRLAVNLSPVQLRDRNLVKSVVAALEVSGLPANRLELEITETALISSTELSIGMLHQLREMGVEIAMDDFGTGYSSINYLRRFPFDKIKIDRSFVSGSDRDEESSAIVRMIASLGMTLGVKTTAEGVETEDEMKSVRRAGCTEMQGYLLSRPVPAGEIGQILGNHSTIMATR
ncbi:EAL domain-containing protein [Aporhodopirellula aestuarii]|uniref:EAL domain-containing protein n=1 Tax=Aporhodopirellula aestuarii TaxID=2950107 RepID=UPI0021BC3597|nr:EAL domain-containing protein [Aporhodopirellula aestuarii]